MLSIWVLQRIAVVYRRPNLSPWSAWDVAFHSNSNPNQGLSPVSTVPQNVCVHSRQFHFHFSTKIIFQKSQILPKKGTIVLWALWTICHNLLHGSIAILNFFLSALLSLPPDRTLVPKVRFLQEKLRLQLLSLLDKQAQRCLHVVVVMQLLNLQEFVKWLRLEGTFGDCLVQSLC